MAPVVRAIRSAPRLEAFVCSTGQHREMLNQVLELFGIPVDHDLGVMRPGTDLNGLFCRVVDSFGTVVADSRPDRVLVHGDTTSAAAAAVACFHRGIPVGHVEAGLRTWDITRPFPEEFNRRAIDLVADHLYVPTETARLNVGRDAREGRHKIFVTGNTVIDALLQTCAILDATPALTARFRDKLGTLAKDRRFVLVTAHRRESFGQGFRDICAALRRLGERGDIDIVYPVHLNPQVRGPVYDLLGNLNTVHLIEPVNYVEFVYLMRLATLILTDSGGIQEEAPSLGKPVLVLRDVTERPEALAAGSVTLVGTDPDRIVREVSRYLNCPALVAEAETIRNPYGDGRAADRIVDALCAEHAAVA
jgi:UDP-N-acetylglucosamine 2-epimerase (non-hydrolysing)